MKINRKYIREISLEEFCDENDIEVVINERPNGKATGNVHLKKYYGGLQNKISTSCDIIHSSVMTGVVGNGNTEEEVLAVIADVISEETITFEGTVDDRKVYNVPRLVSVWKDGKKVTNPAILKDKFTASCVKCGYYTRKVGHGFYKCYHGDCPAYNRDSVPKNKDHT